MDVPGPARDHPIRARGERAVELGNDFHSLKPAFVLLPLATLCYAVVPAMNYFARGWEHPLLLTGVMRLVFAAGVTAALLATRRPLLSRRGLATARRVARQEWKLVALAMLTTGDVALFSLSYRFVDISVSVVMTAMAPAATVVLLAMLTWGGLTLRQAVGLTVSAMGVLVVLWAGGAGAEAGGGWWQVGAGVLLGMGVAVCNGLVVSALRLGEVLALEWYWDGLGRGTSLVWYGTMLTLALAQGVTAPLFLVVAAPGGLPSSGALILMALMGLTVLLGTWLWSTANGSGWRPAINGLGYLQPGFALLILVVLGISDAVRWGGLVAGMAIIIGANIGLQTWAERKL